jgi:hypothetical protein
MTSRAAITVQVETATGNVELQLHGIRHALRRVADSHEGTTIELNSLPLATCLPSARIEQISFWFK